MRRTTSQGKFGGKGRRSADRGSGEGEAVFFLNPSFWRSDLRLVGVAGQGRTKEGGEEERKAEVGGQLSPLLRACHLDRRVENLLE